MTIKAKIHLLLFCFGFLVLQSAFQLGGCNCGSKGKSSTTAPPGTTTTAGTLKVEVSVMPGPKPAAEKITGDKTISSDNTSDTVTKIVLKPDTANTNTVLWMNPDTEASATKATDTAVIVANVTYEGESSAAKITTRKGSSDADNIGFAVNSGTMEIDVGTFANAKYKADSKKDTTKYAITFLAVAYATSDSTDKKIVEKTKATVTIQVKKRDPPAASGKFKISLKDPDDKSIKLHYVNDDVFRKIEIGYAGNSADDAVLQIEVDKQDLSYVVGTAATLADGKDAKSIPSSATELQKLSKSNQNGQIYLFLRPTDATKTSGTAKVKISGDKVEPASITIDAALVAADLDSIVTGMPIPYKEKLTHKTGSTNILGSNIKKIKYIADTLYACNDTQLFKLEGKTFALVGTISKPVGAKFEDFTIVDKTKIVAIINSSEPYLVKADLTQEFDFTAKPEDKYLKINKLIGWGGGSFIDLVKDKVIICSKRAQKGTTDESKHKKDNLVCIEVDTAAISDPGKLPLKVASVKKDASTDLDNVTKINEGPIASFDISSGVYVDSAFGTDSLAIAGKENFVVTYVKEKKLYGKIIPSTDLKPTDQQTITGDEISTSDSLISGYHDPVSTNFVIHYKEKKYTFGKDLSELVRNKDKLIIENFTSIVLAKDAYALLKGKDVYVVKDPSQALADDKKVTAKFVVNNVYSSNSVVVSSAPTDLFFIAVDRYIYAVPAK